MTIREHTMAGAAALGGPVAWGLDLLASYAVTLQSHATHAAQLAHDKLEIHFVTLAVTAAVALVGLLSWRALRHAPPRRSEGWRFMATSSLLLNVLFVLLIASTALLRLASVQ